ncbi:hypothetical protein CROQUDRAFT_111297 [Cronartium quercuum f. sp. fusiforme G11]|uniref:Uncharacterized protein n=1 Tax=Cronartium quercuum f. sp. fusiforme G11 TaxID=708437 RepID=A0A9P6N6M7_9BASI|nr:hypothetical protein CROQUDRAFT_111297 [Cronartium quercuum f. sp. fusiforme G11]
MRSKSAKLYHELVFPVAAGIDEEVVERLSYKNGMGLDVALPLDVVKDTLSMHKELEVSSPGQAVMMGTMNNPTENAHEVSDSIPEEIRNIEHDKDPNVKNSAYGPVKHGVSLRNDLPQDTDTKATEADSKSEASSSDLDAEPDGKGHCSPVHPPELLPSVHSSEEDISPSDKTKPSGILSTQPEISEKHHDVDLVDGEPNPSSALSAYAPEYATMPLFHLGRTRNSLQSPEILLGRSIVHQPSPVGLLSSSCRNYNHRSGAFSDFSTAADLNGPLAHSFEDPYNWLYSHSPSDGYYTDDYLNTMSSHHTSVLTYLGAYIPGQPFGDPCNYVTIPTVPQVINITMDTIGPGSIQGHMAFGQVQALGIQASL